MLKLTSVLVAASMVVGQTEEAAITVPEEVLSEFEYFVGNWEGTGTLDGQEFSVKYEFRWADNKASLSYTHRGRDPEGPWMASGIMGWDAVNKQVVILEFGVEGEHALVHLRREKPRKLWQGKITATNTRTGETEKSQWMLEKKGPDQFTFSSKTLDGTIESTTRLRKQ